MKLVSFLSGSLFFISTAIFADTLYQANVGGYSTSSGVGLGVAIGPAGVPYSSYTAGYYGTGVTAAPYNGFNYPYSSGCCGCNTCNNCGTSYANRGQ